MVIKRLSAIILLITLLAACQTDDEPLPTLAQFPSLTPVASSTDTPTVTRTPIPTFTPTHTATITATRTPLPTSTATETPIPTSTRRPSRTPIPTATLTPTLTYTPIVLPSPTDNPPTISNFQSNLNSAGAGDEVRIRWLTDANTVVLERINEANEILESYPVGNIGSTTVTLPADARLARYRLTAERDGSVATAFVNIRIGTFCDTNWFFGAPPDDTIGCPSQPSFQVNFAYQLFESGAMFRYQDGFIDTVCAMQFDRNLYTCYSPSPPPLPTATPPPTPTPTITPTPPVTTPEPNQGNVLPDVQFSDVFYFQLATGGFWYDIIGWGVTPLQTVNVVAQRNDQTLVLATPFGTFAFDSNLNGQQRTFTRIE